jgi:glycosyltransferase involved in cell wall biosynthesis
MAREVTRLLAVSALPEVAGGESILLRILPRLAGLGYQVRLAVPAPGGLQDAAHARGISTMVIPLGPPEAFTARAVRGALVAIPRLARTDVVWLNGPSTQRLVPVMALTRCRGVLRFNNPLTRPPAWWRRTRYWDIVPVVTVPSQATADECIAAGAPPESVRVMPPPAWHDQPPVAAPRAGGGLRVGFVGTLEPRKGVIDLIRAADSFLARHPESTLTVIGGPPPGDDGRYAARLWEEAAAARAHDRITFRGYVPGAAAAIAGFDVLVIPSHAEPVATVTGEAAAAGVPVVAARVGGLPEGVAGGGVLVPPGDPRALGEAISGLLDDPERRRELSERARAGASRFDPKRFAENMDSLLRGIAR